MNNPNPFVPQGSLLEQQSKRRSRMKLGVLCVLVVGVAGLTAMLIQGCKREQVTEQKTSRRWKPTRWLPWIRILRQWWRPIRRWRRRRLWRAAGAPKPPGPNMSSSRATRSGKIAKKNGVKLSALKAANPGVDPTKLKVGQKITVPAGGTAPAAAMAPVQPLDTARVAKLTR